MLRVINNHRRAAYHGAGEDYEQLTIKTESGNSGGTVPAGSVARRASSPAGPRVGTRHGVRICNAQTTVIAPTGTIGLVMDRDITPSLVQVSANCGLAVSQHIINQSPPPASEDPGLHSSRKFRRWVRRIARAGAR